MDSAKWILAFLLFSCGNGEEEKKGDDGKKKVDVEELFGLGNGDPDKVRERDELKMEEEAKEIPNNVIEKHTDYEIREYPRSKWICTKETIDLKEEQPFDDWKDKYNRDPYRVLADKRFKEMKETKMMFRLLGYVLGSNDRNEKIPMTKPATGRWKPNGRDTAKVELCIWAGTKWADRDLPQPKDDRIYFQRMKRIVVYVREFSGWALVHRDFEKELDSLRDSLRDRGESRRAERDNYFTACYQSPFKKKDRRNEVWIVRED